MAQETRICTACNTSKALSDFDRSGTRGGYRSVCRVCRNESRKKAYSKWLGYAYALTAAERVFLYARRPGGVAA